MEIRHVHVGTIIRWYYIDTSFVSIDSITVYTEFMRIPGDVGLHSTTRYSRIFEVKMVLSSMGFVICEIDTSAVPPCRCRYCRFLDVWNTEPALGLKKKSPKSKVPCYAFDSNVHSFWSRALSKKIQPCRWSEAGHECRLPSPCDRLMGFDPLTVWVGRRPPAPLHHLQMWPGSHETKQMETGWGLDFWCVRDMVKQDKTW